jgi:hypothetical protein
MAGRLDPGRIVVALPGLKWVRSLLRVAARAASVASIGLEPRARRLLLVAVRSQTENANASRPASHTDLVHEVECMRVAQE